MLRRPARGRARRRLLHGLRRIPRRRRSPARQRSRRGGGRDLVLGARVAERGAWPVHARLANRVLAAEIRRRTGLPLRDLGPMRAARRRRRCSSSVSATAGSDGRSRWWCGPPRRGWRIAEVDVPYRPRVGASKVTGTVRGTARTVHDMADGAAMSRRTPTVLVLAKEPVAGRVKTRLCPPCTPAAGRGDRRRPRSRTRSRRSPRPPATRPLLVLDGAVGPWLPTPIERGRAVRRRTRRPARGRVHPCRRPGGARGDGHAPGLGRRASTTPSRGSRRPNVDAVLGLTPDGGWWIIGFRTPVPDAFLGVEMSSATTGAQQRGRLDALGLRTELVAPETDIDTFADALAVADAHPHLRTRACGPSRGRLAGGRARDESSERRACVTSPAPCSRRRPPAGSGPPTRPSSARSPALVGPVLDIGCGPGRHVFALAERGIPVLGIDITAAHARPRPGPVDPGAGAVRVRPRARRRALAERAPPRRQHRHRRRSRAAPPTGPRTARRHRADTRGARSARHGIAPEPRPTRGRRRRRSVVRLGARRRRRPRRARRPPPAPAPARAGRTTAGGSRGSTREAAARSDRSVRTRSRARRDRSARPRCSGSPSASASRSASSPACTRTSRSTRRRGSRSRPDPPGSTGSRRACTSRRARVDPAVARQAVDASSRSSSRGRRSTASRRRSNG